MGLAIKIHKIAVYCMPAEIAALVMARETTNVVHINLDRFRTVFLTIWWSSSATESTSYAFQSQQFKT